MNNIGNERYVRVHVLLMSYIMASFVLEWKRPLYVSYIPALYGLRSTNVKIDQGLPTAYSSMLKMFVHSIWM